MRIPTRQEFEAGQSFKAVQAIDVTTLTELVGRIERLAAENGELKYALDKAHEDLHQAQRGIRERDECIKKNADELVKYKAGCGVAPGSYVHKDVAASTVITVLQKMWHEGSNAGCEFAAQALGIPLDEIKKRMCRG